MRKKPSDHEKHLTRRFKENPQNAVDYLNACLEDKDPRVFLLALQDVARAFGGMTQLAKKTGISREHLYTTLSENGNPAFANLTMVLSALDFKMEIKPKKKPQPRRAKSNNPPRDFGMGRIDVSPTTRTTPWLTRILHEE